MIMGEIAEMTLEGVLCAGCGEYLGGAAGYPRRCAGCKIDMLPKQQTTKNRITCPHCGKWVKKKGLEMHIAAKHKSNLNEPEGK